VLRKNFIGKKSIEQTSHSGAGIKTLVLNMSLRG
jgi:hypothetical protein